MYITSHYGIVTVKIAAPKLNHKKNQIQTDDIDIEFSKFFIGYIKNITPKFIQSKLYIHKRCIFNYS